MAPADRVSGRSKPCASWSPKPRAPPRRDHGAPLPGRRDRRDAGGPGPGLPARGLGPGSGWDCARVGRFGAWLARPKPTPNKRRAPHQAAATAEARRAETGRSRARTQGLTCPPGASGTTTVPPKRAKARPTGTRWRATVRCGFRLRCGADDAEAIVGIPTIAIAIDERRSPLLENSRGCG